MSGWWWFFLLLVLIWLVKLAKTPASSAPVAQLEAAGGGGLTITQPAGLPKGCAGFIRSNGHFEFEIVGEYYYQDALKRIMRAAPVRGLRQEFTAMIIPESDNPHDGLAVRIEINGETVGRIQRDEARLWREQLKQAGFRGKTLACRARVVAEAPRYDADDDWTFQVYLDID